MQLPNLAANVRRQCRRHWQIDVDTQLPLYPRRYYQMVSPHDGTVACSDRLPVTEKEQDVRGGVHRAGGCLHGGLFLRIQSAIEDNDMRRSLGTGDATLTSVLHLVFNTQRMQSLLDSSVVVVALGVACRLSNGTLLGATCHGPHLSYLLSAPTTDPSHAR